MEKIKISGIKINKKSFFSQLALMFGFTIFSASVLSGGKLADEMKQWQGIIAIIIGNLFLALYGSFIAYISKKKNLNLDGVLKRTFGEFGAIIPSMIMIITQTGWMGVGIAMIAIPISDVLGISAWWMVFPIAIMIISTAYFGIKSLTIISLIGVPLIALLGFTIITMTVSRDVFNPTTTYTIGAFTGISLVIGTFISGATFVPNFAVNAKNEKHAVITTFLAFLIGNGFMVAFGFIAALYDKDKVYDFVGIAKKQGLLWVGMIILIMNIWTTNDSALYSVSLGMKNWFKIPKKLGVIIFGLISAAGSIWLFKNFIFFLAMMNAFVPAIGAIIISRLCLNRKEITFYWKKIDWVMIGIWGLASGITFINVLNPYAPLIAFAVAFGLSILITWLENKWSASTKNTVIKN